MAIRVLGLDLGKQTGFGLIGPGAPVRSGSYEIVKKWSPFGPALISLENRLNGLIILHSPTHLAVARPFVRRGRGGAMIDTPQNLVPMFGAFAILHRLAAMCGVPVEVMEGTARSVMLGKFLPGRSEAIKTAIMAACRARGWPVTDDHAADALCVAAAVLERLKPSQAHQTTPLFQAAPAPPAKPRETDAIRQTASKTGLVCPAVMPRYSEVKVILCHPGAMDGSNTARALLTGTQIVLRQGAVSYASWLLLCQKQPGDPFSILMRIDR